MIGNNAAGKLPAAVRVAAWAALVAAFVAMYLPVGIGLVRSWIASEDNSHGFAIIPVAAYMVWQQRERLAATESQGSWTGFLVTIISLATFVFGQLGEVLTLTSVSMITLLWGIVIFLFGWRRFKVAIIPLVFLLLMIPVPAQIYAALTIPLQLVVTKATVALAAMFGIPVLREGNVIHLPEKTLQVVQACSGMRSIMTMLTLGIVFGYFSLKSLMSRAILLVVGVPIAVAVNVVRVLALVVAFHYFKLDLAVGTPHTILGIGVFALALGMFVAAQRGLARWEK